MKESITIVSLGRHTRLGDVLERAVDGVAFETVDVGDLSRENRFSRRLLFAASADASGFNENLRGLTARLLDGGCVLGDCSIAMIADGEQGGAIHLDAMRLLLAANAAGAEIIVRPLLESGRDLRNFSMESNGKESPFDRYCVLACELTKRLSEYKTVSCEKRRVRFASALDDGAVNDWRGAIARMAILAGAELTDESNAEETIVLCENNNGLPDERTLNLLSGGGGIRFLIASPATGADLYAAALFERACLRGSYTLPPNAVTVFEGLSAVEALASRAEMERLKSLF